MYNSVLAEKDDKRVHGNGRATRKFGIVILKILDLRAGFHVSQLSDAYLRMGHLVRCALSRLVGQDCGHHAALTDNNYKIMTGLWNARRTI